MEAGVDLGEIKKKKETEDREALIAMLGLLSSNPAFISGELTVECIFGLGNENIISRLQNEGTLLQHMRALKELKTQEEQLLPHAQPEAEKRKLDAVNTDVINAVLKTSEEKSSGVLVSSTSLSSSQRHLLLAPPTNGNGPDKEIPVKLFKTGLFFLGAAGLVSFIAVSTQLYPLLALSGMCAIIGGALMLTASGMNQEKTSLWDQAFPPEKNYDHNFYPAAFL